jgi:CRP-like cAMP-binding protein
VQEGTKPNEVFFLVHGYVESLKSKKFFAEGAMFGESDIIFGRERLDTYQTRVDC